MRILPTRLLLRIASVLLSGIFHSAYANTSNIQMLPPLDFNGNVCAGANTGVLYWDGTNPIHCIPRFTGAGNGDVGIGTTAPFSGWTWGGGGLDIALGQSVVRLAGGSPATFTASLAAFSDRFEIAAGAPIGFSTHGSGENDTQLWLTTAGNVGIGTATPASKLEVNGDTKIDGAVGIAGAISPLDGNDVNILHAIENKACPAGQVLYATASSGGTLTFNCVDATNISQVQNVLNFSCPGGYYLAGVTNGSPNCQPLPSQPPSPLPNCPDGQTIVYQNGVPTCTTPASGTPVFARQTGAIVGSGGWDNALINGLAANGVTPATDAVDYNDHMQECSTEGGTIDPTQRVTIQDCQMIVCEGVLGLGVRLYAPGGTCPANQNNPACLNDGYYPQSVINLTCFY